jgi:hypothetical protein
MQPLQEEALQVITGLYTRTLAIIQAKTWQGNLTLSKQSAEALAARNADAFTTVSEITASECKQFLNKPVDIITPNGFENSFIPTV